MASNVNPTPQTSATKHTWRKVQGDYYTISSSYGKRDEPKFLGSLRKVGEDFSAYEVTFTLNLNDTPGGARVTDMGWLSKTYSVDTVEATINAFHSNARFAVSDQSQWADKGKSNQIVEDFKYRMQGSIDALVEKDANYFWGTSSAVIAITDTTIVGTSTAALLLKNAYGNSAINNKRYLGKLFNVGDTIALMAAGSDVLIDANAWGDITAINYTTGALAVTWNGSVSSYSTPGIRIVFANNLEGAASGTTRTVDNGTDYNKGYVGILESMFSTTVHSVSGGTYARWNPAVADSTTGGRFNPVNYWQAKDGIKNESGLEADTMLVAQGVKRDMILQQTAGLRFEDSESMDFDGDVKTKGVKQWTMKNTPNGMVFILAKEAMNYWEIIGMEGTRAKGALLAYINQAAKVGRFDKFGNIVTRARAAMAYFTGKTEA